MKETNHINPEIQALLDRMVRNTDKWIEDNNKALKRERINDEKRDKEINEALKKLTH